MTHRQRKVFIPATSSDFATHNLGQTYPCLITAVRGTAKGQMVVFKTQNGYGGKSFSGQYSKSYASLECDKFKVENLSDLIGKKAFATFKASPHFAYDLTPALAIDLSDDKQGFIESSGDIGEISP